MFGVYDFYMTDPALSFQLLLHYTTRPSLFTMVDDETHPNAVHDQDPQHPRMSSEPLSCICSVKICTFVPSFTLTNCDNMATFGYLQ